MVHVSHEDCLIQNTLSDKVLFVISELIKAKWKSLPTNKKYLILHEFFACPLFYFTWISSWGPFY